MATSGLNFEDREPDVVLPQPSPQRAANLEFFHRYDAPAAHSYKLDIAALKKASTRIVLAGGRTSREMWPHRSAEALANRLGTAFVEFPGGHNGHVLHPRAFAARLRAVLGDDQGT
jgi:pimeloyl-ACP methyl ester carboxylesterase